MSYTDPTIPDPREDKLPKWAQENLQRLRRRLQDSQTAFRDAQLVTAPNESDAILDPYETKIGLGIRPQIRYYPDGQTGPAEYRYLDVLLAYQHRGWLEVRGEGQLVIQPRSSNSVLIKVSDR